MERLLVEQYRAYEIPLHSNSRSDYENDPAVRAEFIDRLFTITHPAVLRELSAPGAADESDDEADEYWREFFVEYPDEPGDSLSYRLLVTQHALGQRVSIVLEREGEHITGFKAYGALAEAVNRHLSVVIGFPERRATDPWDSATMTRGDLSDPTFVDYLQRLSDAGVI